VVPNRRCGLTDDSARTFQVIDRVSAVYGVRFEERTTLLSPAVVEDKLLHLLAATTGRADVDVDVDATDSATSDGDVVDCFVHVTAPGPGSGPGLGAASAVAVVLVLQRWNSRSRSRRDSREEDALAAAWLRRIRHLAEETDQLLPHEIPRRVILTAQAFSIENRMLTPSFKKARKDIINAFFGP
jgi:hypothetical protein